MKVAVLWTKLSGYLNSCLQALAQTPGVELFVAYEQATADAPYQDDQFSWIPNVYRYAKLPNEAELLPRLKTFQPDVMVVASWHRPAYRAACRKFQGRALRVCGMDNQWEGRLKQWIGVTTAPFYVRQLFDAAFVPGERQAEFARRLGFTEDRIWRGSLSCDIDRFTAVYEERNRMAQLPESFVCVGRLAPEKGFDTLLAAYKLYCEQSQKPWPLLVAGEGSLRRELEGVPGVQLLGFIQPNDLPRTLLRAGCFVLPSQWEPWGVAIHEAAAAGLPIICTSVCGAAVHLVQDGYNGYLTEKGNARSLAQSLQRITELDPASRRRMGDASYRMSLQFTPSRWANAIFNRGREMMAKGTTA